MITTEQLSKCMPRCRDPEGWAKLINQWAPAAGINTSLRLAGFVSQCGHESADFNVLQENLNYSATALTQVFGRHFRNVDPQSYHRQPQRIANRVYANRMGNGSEASGDGWRFRGRGLIQVTGRNNYTACSEYMYQDQTLLEHPELLATPEGACRSALWYWTVNDLNSWCDQQDVVTLTRRINGGTHGLDDRQRRWQLALRVLGG